MEQTPAISVVIPCYNAARFLRETLDSVFAQTFQPCEVIVVDDGSTDNSATIAAEYGSSVTLIRQPNQGESVARNRGMEAAKGEWVAFLDADDVWVPEKLERQVEIIRQNSDLVCVMSRFYWFGTETGLPSNEIYEQGQDLPLVERIILFPIIHPSSAVVRRDCGVRFPEWTQYAEDVNFFAELACKGHFYFMEAPLIGYRRHESAQLNSCDNPVLKHIDGRLQWLKRQVGILADSQRDQLAALLINPLVEQAIAARYGRRWKFYWQIRKTLAQYAIFPSARSIISERIYPRFLYRIKDQFDGILRYLRPKRTPVAVSSGKTGGNGQVE